MGLAESRVLPPEAQMNFDDLNFARTSGVSPSSSTSDGTMLHISIFAWSARDSIRLMFGRTSEGPKIQSRLYRAGMRMSIIIPAPCKLETQFIGLTIIQMRFGIRHARDS